MRSMFLRGLPTGGRPGKALAYEKQLIFKG